MGYAVDNEEIEEGVTRTTRRFARAKIRSA
jgi:hypothetical protein